MRVEVRDTEDYREYFEDPLIRQAARDTTPRSLSETVGSLETRLGFWRVRVPARIISIKQGLARLFGVFNSQQPLEGPVWDGVSDVSY